MYPEDCVQSFAKEWWVKDDSHEPSRGRLLRTFVPYPEMKPHRLVAEGRGDEPRQHGRALFRVEPFRIGDSPPSAGTLPVAALPLRAGEVYYVQRGKVRPALLVSMGGEQVGRDVRSGKEHWQSARTLIVAPYYGADPGGTRGGWPAAFVERIRRAEYSRFIWDRLPIPGPEESILRLDHVFPIGADPAGYQLLPYRLSPAALLVIDDWIDWLITGKLRLGELADIRELLADEPSPTPPPTAGG
jgi:hypothetical protein